MTESDIIDLRTWSSAKRRYNDTVRARLQPWEHLTPAQRQMFYTIERTRIKILREGPTS